MCAVLGDASRHAHAAPDADGVDAQCGKEARDAASLCQSIVFPCRCASVGSGSRKDLQVHLPVAQRPVRRHVLGDAADAARRTRDDLIPLVALVELQEAVPVDQDAEMAAPTVSIKSVAVKCPWNKTYLYARCRRHVQTDSLPSSVAHLMLSGKLLRHASSAVSRPSTSAAVDAGCPGEN